MSGPQDDEASDAEQTRHTRQSDADIVSATRTDDAEKLAVTRHQRINLIWEYTQAFIALAAVVAALTSSVFLIVQGHDPLAERGYQFLTNIGLLVVGFYFGRTNHTRPTGEKSGP